MRRFDFASVFLSDLGFVKNFSIIEKEGKIKDVLPTVMAKSNYIIPEVLEYTEQVALPGFIDAHSHFPDIGLINEYWINLTWENKLKYSIIDVIIQLKKMEKTRRFKNWIIAYGIQFHEIKEKRLPIRNELDVVSSFLPVVVFDKTMHFASLNTIAMKKCGIKALELYPDLVNFDKGLLCEQAVTVVENIMPTFSYEEYLQGLLIAQEIYLTNGFTTVQVGALSNLTYWHYLPRAIETGKLVVRVVVWPTLSIFKEIEDYPINLEIKDRLFIGPVKLFSDGEFQLGTASTNYPYFGCRKCRNEPLLLSEVKIHIRELASNYDLAIHAHGDLAINTVLNEIYCCHRAQDFISERRHQLVHATLLNTKILDTRYKNLVTPTYLISTLKYWDDEFIQLIFGDKHNDIFRVADSYKFGIPFSLH